jgi:hypothetical protein
MHPGEPERERGEGQRDDREVEGEGKKGRRGQREKVGRVEGRGEERG